MAFTRTLPVATPRVVLPVEPEPPAVEPAIAQPQSPSNEPALAVLPTLPDAVEAPAASTTGPLATRRRQAVSRRFRAPSLVGIAAGAVLGFGAAAYFIGGSTRAAPTSAARPAPPKAASSAPAREMAVQAIAAAPALPVPAAVPANTNEAATLPLASGSAPSCPELLGSAAVEKRDPAAAFEQTQLGQRELVRGNVIGTQQAFCRAALWDETNAERWLNLAQIFLIRRDAAKASDCARTALELQVNSSRALTILGDASAMLGKTAEARQAYLTAENRSEVDPAALRLMIRRDIEEAQRMVRRRDFVRAERLFRRVTVFDAGHAEANAGLTMCLAKLHNAK